MKNVNDRLARIAQTMRQYPHESYVVVRQLALVERRSVAR
jgi:hypothetical protein